MKYFSILWISRRTGHVRGGGGGLKAGPGRRVRREKGGPAAVRG